MKHRWKSVMRMYRIKLFKKKEKQLFSSTQSDYKHETVLKWLILAGLALSLVPMFPRGRSLQFADLKEGSISSRRIIAPFGFEILKSEEEYNHDREQAANKVYPIFIRDNAISDLSMTNLKECFDYLKSARSQYLTLPSQRLALRDSLINKFPIPGIKHTDWDLLVNPRGEIGLEAFDRIYTILSTFFRDVSTVGVLDKLKSNIAIPDARLIISDKSEETVVSFNDFYDLQEVRQKATETLTSAFPREKSILPIGLAFIQYFLKPNMIYQENEHLARITEAQRRVPLSSGFVQENEKIVDENEKITAETRKKLDSLSQKMAEMGLQEGGLKRLYPFFGKLTFVAVVLVLMAIFVFFERPGLWNNPKLLLLMALIFLMISGSTFFVKQLNFSGYLAPVAIGSMLIATIFGERIGYAGSAVLSVLVGGIWGNEFSLMLVSFFTGSVAIVVITRIRNRSQLLRASIYMIAANLISITAMGFLQFLPFTEILANWRFGAMNGLFTPIFSYSLLAIIESLFDITTDHSLLDLSNLNHPLLKRLSVEATGTYHHSIMVGNLAEAAASTIGANSLMARVGSYYHDIGKLEKSEYFVENQIGSENPHKKLQPRMSALILMNHVKRGIEMAEKYKLPSAVKDIIIQHHGKSLMRFFYQKAISKGNTDDVSENDYRYSGPLPQTKEAAIVMLADAVEAAARSLKDPTHSRLKGLIEEIVDERFQSGELDQSPLALRDLERIKESFLTILAGVFHTRIEYPENDDLKKSVKSEEADAED